MSTTKEQYTEAMGSVLAARDTDRLQFSRPEHRAGPAGDFPVYSGLQRLRKIPIWLDIDEPTLAGLARGFPTYVLNDAEVRLDTVAAYVETLEAKVNELTMLFGLGEDKNVELLEELTKLKEK